MSDKKITKSDLVDMVHENTSCEKQLIVQITDKLFDALKNSLAGGYTVEMRGFGTLEPRLRKGRVKARNPKTGEATSSKPHYVAAFRAGKELKQKMFELEQDILNPTKNQE